MQHLNVQDNQNVFYKNKYSTKSLCCLVPNIYHLFKYICIKSSLYHILSQQNTRILVIAPAITANSSALPH